MISPREDSRQDADLFVVMLLISTSFLRRLDSFDCHKVVFATLAMLTCSGTFYKRQECNLLIKVALRSLVENLGWRPDKTFKYLIIITNFLSASNGNFDYPSLSQDFKQKP